MHLAARLRLLGATLLAVCLGLVLAAPASAADVRQGQAVVIAPSETIDDDLYLFGSTITILGTVNGDVVAAGSTVAIGGRVNGSVMAAGGSTTITGDVRGSVRAAGGAVDVSGPVGADLLAGAGSLRVAPSGRIGRDVLAGGGSAELLAGVGRNVLAAGDTITLGGPVGGDVRVQAGTLRLAPGADVQGSLAYTSGNAADIQPGATVHGQVERMEPPNQPAAQRSAPAWVAGAAIGWLQGLVGLGVAALVFTFLFPAFARRTAATLFAAPWPSLGSGVVASLALPLLAVVTFVSGLVVGGWWLALFMLAAYALLGVLGLLSAAEVIGVQCLGWLRQPQRHPAWPTLLGLLVLWLLGLVPMVGGLILFVATAFGAGALLLSLVQVHRGRPVPVRIPAAAQAPLRPAPIGA
jgi:cytoskeletal protein CcmA (bactofilin family)